MSKNRYEVAKEQTKDKIQHAFIELLQDQPYEDITVRDIADHANIGFKTFYRHYSEKIKVAEAIAQNIMLSLSERVIAPTDLDAVRENVRNLLQITQENMDLFRALSRTPIRDNFPQALQLFGMSEGLRLHQANQDVDEGHNPQRVDLITSHFLNSQLSIVIWWVEHDAQLPIEDVEQLIMDLVIIPIWNLGNLEK